MIKIGKFIAELRKEQGLTQEQLGEKLGVTNKTVSRWETGTYLPPVEALLSMSQLFSLSINEILSGQKLCEEEYKEAAEKNLANAIKASNFSLKERIDFYKKKWLKDHMALIIIIGIIILSVFTIGLIQRRSVMVIISLILVILAHGYRNNAMMSYVESHVYNIKQDVKG